MEEDEILQGLEDSVAAFDVRNCVAYAQAAMDGGVPPERAIDAGLAKGMNRISEMFDAGEVFLPQILMASRAMEAALAVIEPHMDTGARLKGVVVMGSVKGDVHSIGKNVCCAMLRGSGFKVVDLGVDVPAEAFAEAARAEGADVIGGSALMTVSLPMQREIVRISKEEGLSVLTIFGGAPCSEEWVEEIGGDGYSANAGSIVGLVERLLREAGDRGGPVGPCGGTPAPPSPL